MKFKKYLIEKEDLKKSDAGKLAIDLEKMIKKIFPKSYIDSKFSNYIYPSVRIEFALGKDSKEWSNGIIQNDPLHTHIKIDKMNKDGSIDGDLAIDKTFSKILLRTKNDNPHLFDSVTTVLRKKSKIKPEKVVAYLKPFFEKLKLAYKENKDNLY